MISEYAKTLTEEGTFPFTYTVSYEQGDEPIDTEKATVDATVKWIGSFLGADAADAAKPTLQLSKDRYHIDGVSMFNVRGNLPDAYRERAQKLARDYSHDFDLE